MTTCGPRVVDKAHFPQSAPLTWIEYGKSGVNMKVTPQKRVSVPVTGQRTTGAAAGRGQRAETTAGGSRSEEELHDKEGFHPLTLSQEDTVHREPAVSLGRGTARVSDQRFLELTAVPLWCR